MSTAAWRCSPLVSARSLGRLRSAWGSPALRLSVGVVAINRLVLGVVGWLNASPPPRGTTTLGLDRLIELPGSLAGTLVGPWQRDDGLWYQWIASGGYGVHPGQAAFFPLYPAMVHAGGVMLGGAYGVAALLVSTAALVAALFLLYQLVAADIDPATARRTVMYAACAPFAFFYLAPFTESLFLMLSVAAVLEARRRRFLMAGIAAALAATCRPQGVALIVPLAWEAAVDIRRRRRGGSVGLSWSHVATLLPAGALALVLIFLAQQNRVGGYLAAEHFWGNHFAAPWVVLSDSLRSIATGGHAEESANVVAALLAVACIPLMWNRLPRSYALFTAAMALPIWFQEHGFSPLMSTGRYVVVIFPLFALLATVTPGVRARRLVIAMFAAVMIDFFLNFTHYHFVG